MAVKYSRGTIVIVAQVPDTNNRNHKDRPVVLVRDVDDTDSSIFGVAVTTTFTRPLSATSVPLPYHRQRRCKTGLDKENVAECTWLVRALPTDILHVCGFTPAPQLLTILEAVKNALPSQPQPPTTSGP